MRKGYKAKNRWSAGILLLLLVAVWLTAHAAAGMGRRSVTGCKADGGRHRVMEERFGR